MIRRAFVAIAFGLMFVGPAMGQYPRGVERPGVAVVMRDKIDGAAITSGTVSGYRLLDGGTQTALTNAIVHEGNGQWSVTLTAAEMTADTVALLFTHADAANVPLTIIPTTTTPATIADSVWDELLAGHAVGSSFAELFTGYDGRLATLESESTATGQGIEDLQTSIDDLPTIAEFNARTLAAASYATAAALDVVDNLLDTEMSAVKAVTDLLSLRLPVSGTISTLTSADTTFSNANADLIAARVAAARGEFYPNRKLVWVLERPDGEGVTVKNDFQISKKAGETLKVWIDFSGLLGRNEAVQSIDSIEVTGDVDVTLVADSDEIVGNLVSCKLTGGTAADVATLKLEVTTTEDQVITVDSAEMLVVE